jgi:hypothetical protein
MPHIWGTSLQQGCHWQSLVRTFVSGGRFIADCTVMLALQVQGESWRVNAGENHLVPGTAE